MMMINTAHYLPIKHEASRLAQRLKQLFIALSNSYKICHPARPEFPTLYPVYLYIGFVWLNILVYVNQSTLEVLATDFVTTEQSHG